MGGCDKTTPGAADGRDQHEPAGDLHPGRARCCAATGAASRSAAAPTSGSTGPSCAPARSTSAHWREIEDGIARSPGTCMTMGTASTMTSVAEALGLTLPGAASIPAADSRPRADGRRHGHAASSRWCGRTCKPSRHSSRRLRSTTRSTVALALGGSTNAVIHLIAMARPRRRAARRSTLRRALAHDAACSPTSGPSGKYLMEDFYYAGGLARAARARSATCSISRAPTVNGHDARREHRRRARLQRRRDPCRASVRCRRKAALAVLRGNLAPDGAVIKPPPPERAAASSSRARRRVPRLQRHGGAHRRSRRSP